MKLKSSVRVSFTAALALIATAGIANAEMSNSWPAAGNTFATQTSGLTATTAAARSYRNTGRSSGGSFWNWGSSSASTGSMGAGARVVRFSSAYAPGKIIVSFSDRKLYLVTARGRALAYPVAAPRPQSRWSGTLRVSRKAVNPTWTPTPSMRRENPRLPTTVPGGHPRNPLGVRALYLGSTMYRIHGTDAPWTIGQPVSKGCIRMHNSDVVDLYRRVPVGASVTVTYKRFRT
ncbi:MAG: L,D-transpeptidase [Pseudomonadota bacterium]